MKRHLIRKLKVVALAMVVLVALATASPLGGRGPCQERVWGWPVTQRRGRRWRTQRGPIGSMIGVLAARAVRRLARDMCLRYVLNTAGQTARQRLLRPIRVRIGSWGTNQITSMRTTWPPTRRHGHTVACARRSWKLIRAPSVSSVVYSMRQGIWVKCLPIRQVLYPLPGCIGITMDGLVMQQMRACSSRGWTVRSLSPRPKTPAGKSGSLSLGSYCRGPRTYQRTRSLTSFSERSGTWMPNRGSHGIAGLHGRNALGRTFPSLS